MMRRDAPNDEQGGFGMRVRGGGLHHLLDGSLNAIGEGRTHPTRGLFSGQWSMMRRDTPNDEKGGFGIWVRGGGLHHLLAGSWDAIGKGRTHPTSIYFQSKLVG